MSIILAVKQNLRNLVDSFSACYGVLKISNTYDDYRYAR